MITTDSSKRRGYNSCKTFGNNFSGNMRSTRNRTFHWLLAIAIVCVGGISECSSSPEPGEGGYFLFTPPFGGNKPPKEVAASRRSGGDTNDITSGAQLSISPSPAETLWVGSHKINWSPLPIFERFLNQNSNNQRREYAQARKYDPQDLPPPPQTQTQEPITTYSPPIPSDPNDSFSKKGLFGFGGHSKPRSQKKSLFHNPHHDFSNKFSTGGFFSGLGPFGPKNAPKIRPPSFSSPIAERRSSSIQPSDFGRDYAVPPTSQSPNTTPSPQDYRQSSTRNTILISPLQAVYALSTPGPSISPIVDRLRQMTEWSRSKQSQKPEVSSSSLMKKEGHSQSQVDSSLDHKLRLKKLLREGHGGSESPKKKSHKNNIEAIILSNDDDDTTEIITGTKLKVQESRDSPRKSRSKPVSVTKRKRKSRGRKVSKEVQQRRKSKKQQKQQIRQENKEFRPQAYQLERPRNSDLIILHPTNAALLQEPLEVQQQSRRRNHELKRKDKQIDLFQNRGDSDVAAAVNREGPISFRFGPEDAKVSPYY